MPVEAMTRSRALILDSVPSENEDRCDRALRPGSMRRLVAGAEEHGGGVVGKPKSDAGGRGTE